MTAATTGTEREVPPPPPVPDRRLLITGGLSAACVVLFLSLFIASHLTRTSDQRETVHPGDFDRVEVSASGPVTVRAEPGAESVRARWELSWSLFEPRVVQEEDGGTLRLSVSCPGLPGRSCGSSVTLVVPRQAAVRVSASGAVQVNGVAGGVEVAGEDGAVDVSDSPGPVWISTRDGSVTGTALTGATDVSTRNGDVALRFGEAPPEVRAATRDGAVDLVLPEPPEGYALHIDRREGAADVGLASRADSERTVTVSTRDGTVRVRPAGNS
ncbi:DUF4097 family beta strand repeat-containing protein [Streptomyces carpaticus]|uniref:DUF4097 family beta strand repeat-containing protein n=1 Tax=Streptomyces carpaticus TaxID=285558 RepID=A0ABV4ZMS2_9ACTN